ncbi:hypothetical protein BCD91_002738 [Clostridium beijerinckii]|uniref:hypothetical protein n=1 Tax=Clostridium beijerinckii TaxID=1520 RepID=UPI00149428DF|nr:hypothetical protein [Clostridium beijerinckii]NOW90715.1 hypothetical protein [Clostridium beijerinckii]
MNIINNILRNGIEYTNYETGLVEFIDFQVCNDNWIQYRIINEKLSREGVTRLRERDKNVGKRDSCSTPSYITFFTKPKMTKIEFDDKNEFRKIRDTIISFGWMTLDFS